MPDFIPLHPDAFKDDPDRFLIAFSCPQCYNEIRDDKRKLPRMNGEDGMMYFCSTWCKRKYKLGQSEDRTYSDRLTEGWFMINGCSEGGE